MLIPISIARLSGSTGHHVPLWLTILGGVVFNLTGNTTSGALSPFLRLTHSLVRFRERTAVRHNATPLPGSLEYAGLLHAAQQKPRERAWHYTVHAI